MNPLVDDALARLNACLPVAARQRELPVELARVHRTILHSLYWRAAVPSRDEIAALLTHRDADSALAQLRKLDLVVFSKDGRLAGAYPMTTEPTPHRLVLPGREINAMCAIDALSVTAMFGGTVEIRSQCRVTGEPVVIRQEGERILDASPETVMAGVRWQRPCGGHAAHSLCMEMVFLKDAAAAQQWHAGALEYHSLFNMEEAVEFGARFFKPLVATAAGA